MKGLPRSMSRGNPLKQELVRLDVAVDETIVINDGAPGYGTAVLAGLPQGNLLFLGAVLNFQATKGDADIIDAFDGDFALGTAPTADGDFGDAGEAVFIPSTATVTAVAGVSTGNRGVSTTTLSGAIIDNTAGDLEVNLNLLIDDTSIAAASSLTVEGSLHMLFAVLGDD